MTSRSLVPVVRKSDITHVKGKARRSRGVPDLRRVLPDEVAGAIEAAGVHGLLVRFLWTTGARISEALEVAAGDFDFVAGCVRLRTLKRRGDHFRAVPLPGPLCGAIAQKIMAEKLGNDSRLWPFTRQHAHAVIRKALLTAGVDAHRARPHALRHGHAFHALASGAPLPVVQKALGHAHVATTGIYLTATAADLRASYDRIVW
jgi:integrase/recombinase XerD